MLRQLEPRCPPSSPPVDAEVAKRAFPRSLFDLLPSDVVFNVVRQARRAYRPAPRTLGYDTRLRAIRQYESGLPLWGDVSGMLVVASAHNPVLALRTVSAYFKDEAIQRGVDSDALIACPRGTPVQAKWPAHSFLERRATGDSYCRDCGDGTRDRCAFRKTPLCQGCQELVRANVIWLTEAASLFDCSTVVEYFDVAEYDRDYYGFRRHAARVKRDVNLPKLKLKVRSPRRFLDVVHARIGVSSGATDKRSAVVQQRFAEIWKALETGDEELCRAAARSIYNRKRPSKTQSSSGDVSSTWRCSLESAASNMCVGCAANVKKFERTLCTWFEGVVLCEECHEAFCGRVGFNSDLPYYGVVVYVNHEGDLNSILDRDARQIFRSSPVQRSGWREPPCRCEVVERAAAGYGVGENNVLDHVAERRSKGRLWDRGPASRLAQSPRETKRPRSRSSTRMQLRSKSSV